MLLVVVRILLQLERSKSKGRRKHNTWLAYCLISPEGVCKLPRQLLQFRYIFIIFSK